ncbi:MAG: hypothetical protein ACR2PA_18690, partial [Hyphomicrobiaceae bacterium]
MYVRRFLHLVLFCLIVGPVHANPPVPEPKPLPLDKRVRKLPPVSAKSLFKSVAQGAALKPAVHGYYTR